MGRQSSLLQAEAATYGRHMSHQALPRLRFRDDISYPLPMPANAGPDGVTDGTDGAVGIPWGFRGERDGGGCHTRLRLVRLRVVCSRVCHLAHQLDDILYHSGAIMGLLWALSSTLVLCPETSCMDHPMLLLLLISHDP